jgi:hypothetical protein
MNDDRTKADKAWEARQEAARYRIFNAATNAAEANDEPDDENYFAVLDQAGNAAEAAAAEITGYKAYADLLEALEAANSPSAAQSVAGAAVHHPRGPLILSGACFLAQTRPPAHHGWPELVGLAQHPDCKCTPETGCSGFEV